MLFNSLTFLVFLPLAFVLYWHIFNKNIKLQNTLVLVLSYIFYGWWDWRFLFLIIASTLLDFILGLYISKSKNSFRKKILLYTSLLFNLGVLGFFKYFNFFKENFEVLLNTMGFKADFITLNILLPVGISFYTFQTLSYTIDVYRDKIKPAHDLIAFGSFVSFFPQLVAGPIERASNLLPQFLKPRRFNYNLAIDGLKQIVWGFFMKIVIADNCAVYVNEIFGDYNNFNALSLLIGAVLFAFQIYGDFAGYSNIAIGLARLFGFNLKQNFAFPYFSRDVAEFWRRWHISLSTWFRDYVYIPLGGSRGNTATKVRNTFIIFLVSGFWHGANWTFIAWGALNAIYFLPLLLLKKNRVNLGIIGESRLPKGREIGSMLVTFFLTVLAWVFFRSASISEAFIFLKKIFTLDSGLSIDIPILLYIILSTFICVEWFGRRNKYALQHIFRHHVYLQKIFIYLIIVAIFLFGQYGTTYEFIYFQF